MYAHVGTAADAQLEKSGVGIDQYFSNFYLGTFNLFLSGLVKIFFLYQKCQAITSKTRIKAYLEMFKYSLPRF